VCPVNMGCYKSKSMERFDANVAAVDVVDTTMEPAALSRGSFRMGEVLLSSCIFECLGHFKSGFVYHKNPSARFLHF